MVNSHDPHRPFFNPDLPLKNNGEEKPSKTFKPEEITVPGFVPDLPGVRKELSHYYNSTRRLDDTFGKIMQALQESGYAENTLVVFLSDNGIAIPFAKANTYDASNRTPLLVRWPNTIKAGSVNTKDFVSAIDLMPTFLDALKIPLRSKTDGATFLPLLTGNPQNNRDRVFSEIDYKYAGAAVPMRSIQTERYLYIFNAWSNGERFYSNNNEGKTLAAMKEEAEANKLIKDRIEMYHYRQPEELYDLTLDPDCLNNLVHNKKEQGVLKQLQSSMEEWMERTNDPVLELFRNKTNSTIAATLYQNIYPEGGNKLRQEQH